MAFGYGYWLQEFRNVKKNYYWPWCIRYTAHCIHTFFTLQFYYGMQAIPNTKHQTITYNLKYKSIVGILHTNTHLGLVFRMSLFYYNMQIELRFCPEKLCCFFSSFFIVWHLHLCVLACLLDLLIKMSNECVKGDKWLWILHSISSLST